MRPPLASRLRANCVGRCVRWRTCLQRVACHSSKDATAMRSSCIRCRCARKSFAAEHNAHRKRAISGARYRILLTCVVEWCVAVVLQATDRRQICDPIFALGIREMLQPKFRRQTIRRKSERGDRAIDSRRRLCGDSRRRRVEAGMRRNLRRRPCCQTHAGGAVMKCESHSARLPAAVDDAYEIDDRKLTRSRHGAEHPAHRARHGAANRQIDEGAVDAADVLHIACEIRADFQVQNLRC